jgi:hypothetical protein
MKKKQTGPSAPTVRAFIARGLAAQKAVDQAIASPEISAALERRRLAFSPTSAPAAPSSAADDVAAAGEAFGAWRRCLGGPKNDCQAWARGDRGCPRHRSDTRPAVQGASGAQRERNHPRRGR